MPTIAMPPAHAVPREFTIRRDERGHWVASEFRGLVEGIFFTSEQAFRFALHEADGDPSRVHLDPVENRSRH